MLALTNAAVGFAPATPLAPAAPVRACLSAQPDMHQPAAPLVGRSYRLAAAPTV